MSGGAWRVMMCTVPSGKTLTSAPFIAHKRSGAAHDMASAAGERDARVATLARHHLTGCAHTLHWPASMQVPSAHSTCTRPPPSVGISHLRGASSTASAKA